MKPFYVNIYAYPDWSGPPSIARNISWKSIKFYHDSDFLSRAHTTVENLFTTKECCSIRGVLTQSRIAEKWNTYVCNRTEDIQSWSSPILQTQHTHTQYKGSHEQKTFSKQGLERHIRISQRSHSIPSTASLAQVQASVTREPHTCWCLPST